MIEYESDPVLSANEHFPSFEERVRASHRGGRPGSPCHSAHGNLYRATLMQQQLKRAKKVSIFIHSFIKTIHSFIHSFIKMITGKTGALKPSHSHWFLTKCSKPIQRLPYYLPNIVVILINICLILCTKAIDFSLFILSGPILQKWGQILQGNGLCRFSRTIPNLWVAIMWADQQSNRGQECHAQWSKEYLFNRRFEENHEFRSAGGRGRICLCFYEYL